MNHIPTITLNNGVVMPTLGLGVLDRHQIDVTVKAVEYALTAGYRLIDTAASYLNETQVGEALHHSLIPRSELFVTTKLWMSDYGYDNTLRACDTSLHKLGLDYVDLYLLHWPVPSNFDATIASYKAAERLLDEHKVRAIGVSNFSVEHLNLLRQNTTVMPAVNQVELNPNFQQQPLRAIHQQLGIITQAWSPIGGGFRRTPGASQRDDPLTHPVITQLAKQYGKTAAQIILRWQIQNGVSAIPKSFNPQRIAENIAIFDFILSPEDMALIETLDKGQRTGPDPETTTASTFSISLDQ
ncbi:aldo/keto reductase [Celerinatantimonas sp. YJH-8]|uniref:aldo/keto reductase n=1 Tax=Celerinatantimonas sp. YJH-8 TaxID=3228714 RepID=UPI0038C9D0C8